MKSSQGQYEIEFKMKHREGRLSLDVAHKPEAALKLADELQKQAC